MNCFEQIIVSNLSPFLSTTTMPFSSLSNANLREKGEGRGVGEGAGERERESSVILFIEGVSF